MLTIVKRGAIDADTMLAFDTTWADDGLGNGEKPVTIDSGALPSGVTPVTGAFNASGASSTFAPIPGRGFNLSLWGSVGNSLAWNGQVGLFRSFDAGVTWLPRDLNLINGPLTSVYEEPEAGVLYQLQCTAVTLGPINYRLSQ